MIYVSINTKWRHACKNNNKYEIHSNNNAKVKR